VAGVGAMSVRDVRPPPCHQRGLVVPAGVRHRACNPTHVQMMAIGADAVGRIGLSIREWFKGWE
jgi:mannose-6-phosphate isomerase-like protein (cupin superfamily)